MLGFFRKHMKKLSILLWVSVIAFVVGGAYLFVSGPFQMGKDVAIRIGKTEISTAEFNQAYNNMYQFYTNLFARIHGGNVTEQDIKALNIKQKTINFLVDRTLLLNAAKNEGIKITNADVRNAIETNPTFFNNGRFSKEKYLAILKANNIKPALYEASLKGDLYIKILQDKLFSHIKITNKQVKSYYAENFSKINFVYVEFPTKDFIKDITVTDSNLKKYYNIHKNAFRVPTEVKLLYVTVPFGYIKAKTEISDEDAKKFYGNNMSLFSHPKKIKVAQILLTKKTHESPEAFKKRAFKIYSMIKSNNFARIAKNYSNDVYSKNKGGLVGYISKDMVVPVFWNHIKNLKVGSITKPFLTHFGYQIVKVEAVKNPFTDTFSNVKDKIIDILKTQKAKRYGFIEAKRVFVALQSSKNWEKTLRDLNLIEKESPYISINNIPLPFSKTIVKNAIISGKGVLLGPAKIMSDSYIIYKVENIKRSYIPNFNKIKNAIEKEYKKQKAKELAMIKADKFFKASYKLKNIAEEANKTKMKLYNSGYLTRFLPTKKMPCTFNKGFLGVVFSKKTGFISTCYTNDRFYVYQIRDKRIDVNDFQRRANNIKVLLKNQAEARIMKNFIEKLKKETKISISSKL